MDEFFSVDDDREDERDGREDNEEKGEAVTTNQRPVTLPVTVTYHVIADRFHQMRRLRSGPIRLPTATAQCCRSRPRRVFSCAVTDLSL